MTVVGVDDTGVHCVWYGETNDEIRAGVIAAVALEPVQIIAEDDEEDEREHKRED